MASNLGLNDHHHLQAINFVRFCRYKRIQSLKGVEQCFLDLEDSRLYDDTYTNDELKEILGNLLKSVHTEIESELLNSSHTSVLLLRQLLTQAEKWHLKLNCDVSELENRELLEQIAAFETKELSLSSGNDLNKLKLNPINETGGAELLNNEIERLRAENKNLLVVIKKQEDSVHECENLNKKLKKQIKDQDNKPKGSSQTKELEDEIKNLRLELASKKESNDSSNKELKENLTSTKHELLRVQDQLEMASKELDLKIQQTNAYKNLKDMLIKKNEQIKELRQQLKLKEACE